MLRSLVLLAPRPVAPGDILFGCGPIQDVLTYPGQPKVSIAQDQVDACKATGLGARAHFSTWSRSRSLSTSALL